MNILVITEKRFVSECIASHVRAHWPTDRVTFVHTVPYANIGFRYPRGGRLQDYPLVAEPRYKLAAWDAWHSGAFDLTPEGELTKRAASLELFTKADLIVFASDPGVTGVMGFEALLTEVFGDDRALECPALNCCAFDSLGLKHAFSNVKPFGEMYQGTLSYGRIKRYFDWNWNANALVVLGDAMRRAGVPADAPPLSKYGLQMLYALRDVPPRPDNEMYRMMTYWPGTGRYQYQAGQYRPRVGGAASRTQILDNLVEAGLLERTTVPGWMGPPNEYAYPPYMLALAERGRVLLALLHPDCEDPDLPFRLDAWCHQGESAKPAIDRYIKTFFGKQLRFAA